MENPPDDLEDPPPFWCHICRIACVSAVNLQSHFLGARHRRAEEALKENREGGGEEEAAKAEESLEDQINALGNAEPALGLEYIYEYRSHNRYQCKLCNCFLGRTHMFMHIVGARHRIQYLGEHHPATGISNASVTKGAKRLRRLREICIRVEQEFGRNRINVVRDEDQVFSCDDPTPTLPCAVYRPNAKLKKMDFTSDEFMEVAEAPEEHEEGVVTFLELKKAHEASLRKPGPAQGRCLQPTAGGSEKDWGGETKKDQAGGPEKSLRGESGKDQAGATEKGLRGEPGKGQAGGPEKGLRGEPGQGQAAGPEKDKDGGNEKYLRGEPGKDQAGGHETGWGDGLEKDQSGELAKGQAGGPEKHQPGEQEKGLAGGPEKDKDGGPEKDQAGEPAKGQAGEPELDKDGGPEVDKDGGPEQDQARELEKCQAGLPNKVGGPENHSGEPEKGQSTGPEKNHVKNKEHELDNKDHSGVYNTEPNPDLDTLPSHEEVFEYLQSFEVHELKHIHFLIKVTDSLRRILTRYRNDEEKKKMEANDGHNQQPLTSQGYPHQPAPILPPEDSVPNPTRCEEEAPANEGHRAVWLSANQLWKRNPQEKLSFRIAAPPPEKNSLVSTQLLSNLQQDFAAKSKPKKIAAASMTHVDEENFAEDPTPPFQPVYDHARDGEEHRVSSSKPGTSSASRHLMAMPPDRVGAGFTKGQFPNEGSATVAAYPHEHVGYTTGSWASNVHDSLVYDRTQEQRLPSSKHHPGPSIAEPGHPMAKPPDRAGAASGRGPYPNEGPAMVSYPHKLLGNPTGSASEPFRNVAGFPDTQDRVRNSAPLYPPGEPVRTPAGSVFPGAAGSQEVLRNVSASSALRTPDSYRQPANSAGAANPPAPFLQQFTAAPGGSPSIFPRDDVTALFFESLKDMDISEVTSTLNKLTATNPAFQRIHVPSLVRYLMDTGKIRTSHRPGNL